MTFMPMQNNRLASIINPGVAQGGGLEQLAQLIMLNQRQPQQLPTANIGGRNILVKQGSNPLARAGNAGMDALFGLAQNYTAMQTIHKRNQFMQGVQQIASSAKTPDEKINDLVGLYSQHGTDYGLGVKDIVQQYGQMANRNSLTQVYGYDESGNLVPKGAVPKGSKVPDIIAQEKLNKETAEKKQQQDAMTEQVIGTAQDMLDTIQKVKNGIKYFGPYGDVGTRLTSLGGAIDYKDRSEWENNVNKLLSAKVVDQIMSMKNASKTGATGFGQLSEKEGQLLREASTALKRTTDKTAAAGYLDTMEKIYQKILNKNNSSQDKQGQPSQNVLTATNPKTGKKIKSLDGGQTWQLAQ